MFNKEKDQILDTAKIRMVRIESHTEYVNTVNHLIENGYSIETDYNLSSESWKISATKPYVVNEDNGETKLFRKIVDTFNRAIDFLEKNGGVRISIDHSVGAISIDIFKREKEPKENNRYLATKL
jgi:hypothetical protein